MPEMRRLSPAEASAALAAWALEDPARSPWPLPVGHDSHMTGEDRPPQPAEPPDLITTLTADTGDWEDASRYLLHQLREPRMRHSTLTLHPSALPPRPPETVSERVAGLLAHGGYVAPVQAISTPGPHEPGIYTVRPDAGHPARMRIGDGDWVPCRVVGFDMAPSGDGTMVTGELGEDGRLHLDGAYRLNIEFELTGQARR